MTHLRRDDIYTKIEEMKARIQVKANVKVGFWIRTYVVEAICLRLKSVFVVGVTSLRYCSTTGLGRFLLAFLLRGGVGGVDR